MLCTYADDVTQIIRYEGKSTQLMARYTARAREQINTFEKKCKIATNSGKFLKENVPRILTTYWNGVQTANEGASDISFGRPKGMRWKNG